MNANDSRLGAEAAEIARLSAEYDALFLLNAGYPHPPDDEQNFEDVLAKAAKIATGALRCSALRFERSALRCVVRNCRSRGGGMRLKARAYGFIPPGRSSIAIAPRPATPASLSGAPSLRRSGG
jgi:hypothetical protein